MTIYHIGTVDFNPDACELSERGHMEHLQPQVRNVLLCLVRHQGQTVSREVLLREAWHGKPVSEECLTRCISILRKQLHDRGAHQLIETVPRVGYRLHCRVGEGSVFRRSSLLIFEHPPTRHECSNFLAAGLLGVLMIFLAITI